MKRIHTVFAIAAVAGVRMITSDPVYGLSVSPIQQEASFVRSSESPFAAGRYEVDFTRANLLATVRAELRVDDGRLFMAGWGADMHKRGWANYVQNLRAREMNGSEANLEEIADSAAWRLVNRTPRIVRIEYQVDLSFATTEWPYGNEQAAILLDEDLYTVSKAIFILSATDGAREVVYRVRPGWHVTTPWPAGSQGIHSYRVDGIESLINNSFVVGPTAPAVAQAGRFTFLLAALGAAQSDRDRVMSALQSIVQEYVWVFPETPDSRYLMTLFRAATRDAEAYRESAAFSEPDSLTSANRMLWAGTLAHELFHAWNGHVIRPSNYSEMQWMSEGFTDYYASRSLARARVIDEDVFIRKLEHTIGLYLFFKAAPVFDGVTLVSAGERKGRNRLGVYNGGWVAAFCLDTEIRTRSAGTKSLDDVMRILHVRFGLTGRSYSRADFQSALAEVLGPHHDDFVSRYVAGNETIPIAECLKRAGYEGAGAGYDGEYYITSRAASPYRQWLFGR